MRNLLRTGFIAISLTFVFSAFAVSETNAQVTTEILKRMDEHNKALTSLRTNVTYEKYDDGLKDTDSREGKAIYLPIKGKNASFRIDWKKPEESLAVTDKQYVLYQPKLGQAVIGNPDKATKNAAGVRSPLAFINMSKAQLKAKYNIKYLGEETVSGSTSTWHLELTPKTAQKYKLAEIWVNKDGMPVQMKIIEKNNDSTTILLTGIEENPTLNGPDFIVNLPSNTKIIKN